MSYNEKNTITSIEITPKGERVIVTPRLVLRGARLDDVDDLFECFRDEEVMRYWSSLPHAEKASTTQFIQDTIKGPNYATLDFVIALRAECEDDVQSQTSHERNGKQYHTLNSRGKVIGKAGVWQDSEIGFLLSREFWGQGYAIEATTAVLDAYFGLLDLERSNVDTDGNEKQQDVVADVDPQNAASLKLLTKLGFVEYAREERTFQIGDLWVDSVYLSLSKADWMKKRAVLAQV